MACSVVEIFRRFRPLTASVFRVDAEECNTILRNGGKFLANLASYPTRQQHSYSLPVEPKSH
jgi:hypothetical protein